MISLILKALSWLLGTIFAKPTGPTQEAVQAANAAQSKTVAQADQQAAVTEVAIAQAVTDAPKSQAGVVDSLNKGEF